MENRTEYQKNQEYLKELKKLELGELLERVRSTVNEFVL